MKVTFHSKGIHLLEEEKEYATKKIKDILHKVHNADEKESIVARYEIDKESTHTEFDKQFFCALTLTIPGKVLRSEAHCSGVYTAVDKANSAMKSQLIKEKFFHKHL